MKRLLLTIFLMLALLGCAEVPLEVPVEGGEVGIWGRIVEKTVTLESGETVVCLVFSGNQKGGLSCDWDNPR